MIGLLVASSLSALAPSISAQTNIAAQNTAITAKTSDGRDFSSLSPSDVKKLNDQEYETYRQWKSAKRKLEEAKIDQAAIEEDVQIRNSPVGKWIVQASKAERLEMPPQEVQVAIQKLASQNPPPSIIFEARKICDKLGIKYTA
jgi:hypothetical protein